MINYFKLHYLKLNISIIVSSAFLLCGFNLAEGRPSKSIQFKVKRLFFGEPLDSCIFLNVRRVINYSDEWTFEINYGFGNSLNI